MRFNGSAARRTPRFAKWIRPGVRVLEIGCGTGADTEFLARLGARIVACDPSEGMLSRTKRRLANAGVGDRVGILSCGLQDLPQFLDALDHAEGFDAVVSNFGALNCAPSLDALGTIGRRHLRAGGAMAIGLMGRTCFGRRSILRCAAIARARRAGERRAWRFRWPASMCRRSITAPATSRPRSAPVSRVTLRSALA